MNEVLKVSGMTCGHCVRAVTEELQKIAGVQDVSVDLESGKVLVTSDALLDHDELKAAIDEAGYELVG